MSADPHRERDLANLGAKASVDSDRGICTIRLTCDAFDRMVTRINTPAAEPTWYEDVKAQLDEAEAALREAAYQVRIAHQDKKRGVA